MRSQAPPARSPLLPLSTAACFLRKWLTLETGAPSPSPIFSLPILRWVSFCYLLLFFSWFACAVLCLKCKFFWFDFLRFIAASDIAVIDSCLIFERILGLQSIVGFVFAPSIQFVFYIVYCIVYIAIFS